MSARAFDVVVVGGGGAGLMAALTAARHGARTLLLEKNATLGGTTRLSVGSVSVARTPQQRALGIADETEHHFEDMGKFAGDLAPRDNLALRRLYVERAPATFGRLMELGLVFADPVPEPPHRVPRLHNVLPHSGSFIRQLSRTFLKAGGTIRTAAPVADLVREDGRVTGVVLASGERIAAARGVIIASGDYSAADPATKAALIADERAEVEGINTAATGDGQRIGEEAGSVVVNPDVVWGPEMRFVAPPRPSIVTRIPPVPAFAKATRWAMRAMPKRLLRPLFMSFVTTFLAPSKRLLSEGGILLNVRGERFCEETEAPEIPVSRQPERKAFILLDRAIAGRFEAWPGYVSTAPGVGYAFLSDYRRNRKDITLTAPTLAALAQKAGLPAEALARTVAAYNADAAARGGRPALGEGPYTLLGPLKSFICFTDGGLKVNEGLQVLTAGGAPIPGLFAAGSAGQGGLLLEGHGHHLGWAFVSGEIAGRSAALGTDEDTEAAGPAESIRDAACTT